MPSLDKPVMNLLGSDIAITSVDRLAQDIHGLVRRGAPAYVCFATAHMLALSTRNTAVQNAYRGAAIISPDGVPVAWAIHLLGARTSQCVSGPRAMPAIFQLASDNQIRIGFYGGRPETLRLLKERISREYPLLQVVYSYSPPFRPLNLEEEDAHVGDIRRSGAQLLFVSLGSPRQECWMHRLSKRMNCVCLGMGAAFEFFTGEKQLPPLWVQRLGLTWMVRLAQEPRRLLVRNLYSPLFVYLVLKWISMSEHRRAAWETTMIRRAAILGLERRGQRLFGQEVTR